VVGKDVMKEEVEEVKALQKEKVAGARAGAEEQCVQQFSYFITMFLLQGKE